MSDNLLSDPSFFADPSRRHRPLLLLDADEVLLQFLKGIETFAETRDLVFVPETFAITGNLRDAKTKRALAQEEVGDFLKAFFSDYTRHLQLVPGALAAVRQLQDVADVAVLSNVPDHAVPDRIACLKDQGLDLPVFGNEGGKGHFVANMIKDRGGLVCFVDDLPPQHDDVEKHAPESHRLHFVADERLRPMLPKAVSAHHRIDTWPEAATYFIDLFDGKQRV